VIKRHGSASEELPSIISRLVALTSTAVDCKGHMSAVCALRQLVQRLPSCRRDVLQHMHSAVTGGVTPEVAANSTHALHACITASETSFSTQISPGMESLRFAGQALQTLPTWLFLQSERHQVGPEPEWQTGCKARVNRNHSKNFTDPFPIRSHLEITFGDQQQLLKISDSAISCIRVCYN
jgi:hypothetical protein